MPVDLIIDNIQAEDAVLIVGPYIKELREGQSLEDAFQVFLKDKCMEVSFDREGLVSLQSRHELLSFQTYIKQFYDQHDVPTDLTKKLVQLPFHLIISASPGFLTKRSFDEQGLPYNFLHYSKHENPDAKTPAPEKRKPLLFNIMGSVTDKNSLVATQADLYKYLFAIIREHELPEKLAIALEKASVFIFIGFDFEKWYFRLILHLLGLHKRAGYASDFPEFTRPDTQNFFIENFEMNFVEETPAQLIEQLYAKAKDIPAFLNQPQDAVPVHEQVKDLAAADEFEEALDLMESYIEEKDEDSDLMGDVFQLKGQFTSLQKKIRRGTIKEDDATLQQNKIRAAILDMVDELKEL